MSAKNRPANIQFDEDVDPPGGVRLALAASGSQIEPDFMDSTRGGDDSISFDDDEIESVAPRRKAKPGMPKWILALAVFMLLAVLGGAYLSFAAFKKRSAAISDDPQVELSAPQSSVPQPVIALAAPAELPPSAAAPAHASESSPAPVQTVAAPGETPSPVAPRDGAALAVAEANAAEIKRLKAQVDQLAASVGVLIAAKDAQPPRQAAPPPAAVKPVVQQAVPVKPSPAPLQKPKASPVREEVLPSYRRDWVISAIVNNRAFVIKKMPDGSEQEMSVVAGDKIDGKLIEVIDGQAKEIKLEGNQRITTGRAR